MKNKKGDFGILVLIVSILVVSSGLIVINEVKNNADNGKISGTGLVLLDREQEENKPVDSSEEINYFERINE